MLLVETGLVKDLPDLYELTAADLMPLEGFKEKKVENLLAGIEAARHRPLARLLFGLGIRPRGRDRRPRPSSPTTPRSETSPRRRARPWRPSTGSARSWPRASSSGSPTT